VATKAFRPVFAIFGPRIDRDAANQVEKGLALGLPKAGGGRQSAARGHALGQGDGLGPPAEQREIVWEGNSVQFEPKWHSTARGPEGLKEKVFLL
jgi:hypothetical protein